jgi:hypothetical protein
MTDPKQHFELIYHIFATKRNHHRCKNESMRGAVAANGVREKAARIFIAVTVKLQPKLRWKCCPLMAVPHLTTKRNGAAAESAASAFIKRMNRQSQACTSIKQQRHGSL